MHDLIYSDQGAVGGVGVCVLFCSDWIGLDWMGEATGVLSRRDMVSIDILAIRSQTLGGREKKRGAGKGESKTGAKKDGPR